MWRRLGREVVTLPKTERIYRQEDCRSFGTGMLLSECMAEPQKQMRREGLSDRLEDSRSDSIT
jgi:hypothetical protein